MFYACWELRTVLCAWLPHHAFCLLGTAEAKFKRGPQCHRALSRTYVTGQQAI